ncbi:BofC C-terminal domain-containing protein [Acetohalobium arabaticum]|uniref:Bypass of forespore C C-terminal domain-containing protein n=1 Tax=Acetohalobium arabaticum (strain ATCC 49924 / DSM 5501 / Z-7288) TaxID=574087 RepID=D9QVI2_ACEAZ|nr:BofC C-terminal domain-containing protein [Acetohalobium arabaticum]ADL12241.1 Domain of unknown function DUF1901 [Acetohalobium arabaticum DSM 5501]
MLDKKKIILISLVIILLASVITYFGLDLRNNESTPQKEDRIKSEAEEDITQSQQKFSQLIKEKREEFETKLELTEERLLTGPNPSLIFKTYYTRCGDIVVDHKKAKNEFEINNLVAKYPQWTLAKKGKERIILKRRVDKVCPEHKEEMYLGIKDGTVAIFYGNPDDEQEILKRKTNISVDLLPAEEIESLKEGIIVESQKELLALLEGLSSIQDEQLK